MLISIEKSSQAEQPEDLVGILLDCHVRIRTFVRLAEEVGRQGEVSDREVVDACQRCERYFMEALPLHVEDEEQSVLPRLKGIRADVDSALETMRGQHSEHEGPLKDLLAEAQNVRNAPSDAQARERLRLCASRLSAEFEKHLSLEEQVIFPAVRSLLTPEVQAQIYEEVRERRRRWI